ncbi:MAG: extracellular solute-binding protein [Deltaproteobacteria bacterium]|nr:extracellular solute-binding protein [Deltaproteobacteria bacterium]
MKRLSVVAGGAIAFFALTGWFEQAKAAPSDELVAAARKEGEIDFHAPSTLTPQGAQALAEAFNKQHNLSIKFRYHPTGGMGTDVAKVVTRSAAGITPEWDVMVVTDAHHATLWLKKLLQPFDYAKVGIDRNVIHYDNGAVSLANQFALPAYNTKLLPAKDAPKRWEDLLDPKWKGGKLGVTVATHHLARLAAEWGEEKTTKYVKDLAKQMPTIGPLGTVYTRLQLGEVVLAAGLTDSFIHRAKKTGAPIAFAEEVQPVISPAYYAAVLKNAAHRNMGHVFIAFLMSPEGQQIWDKFTGESSSFIPGTSAYKYAQGKRVLYMTQEQAQNMDRLRAQYYKILGFTK